MIRRVRWVGGSGRTGNGRAERNGGRDVRKAFGVFGRAVGGIAVALLTVFVGGPAPAHDGTGKVRGTCEVTNQAGRGTMTVAVENLWSGSITDITPSDLLAGASGTATFFIQSFPRPAREILPGKRASFDWRGRLYGDGYLDLSVEVFAEFEDGHIESTGIVNCNRLAVGDPGTQQPPTPTPQNRPTNTPGVSQPTATNTAARPTRTPVESRPTRTTQLDPTSTATANRPAATATRVPATRTATAARPTRTPIVGRPTRTPVVDPTRTPSRTQPVRPSATATATRPQATRTPVQARATRTQGGNPTPRATRTPDNVAPTATPTGGQLPTDGLVANCSLRRNIDLVTITMVVENRTQFEVRGLGASPLSLQPEGGSLFFDRTGPSPGSVPLLRPGASAAFQWNGRLSPAGTMGFSATASGNGPGGAFRTGLVDCGVTGADVANFDPSSFSGTCSIRPGEQGGMTLELRNGSRETLENVEAFFITKTTTGTATMLELRGPAPRNVRQLTPGARREFAFEARFLGNGEVKIQFEGKGSRATSARISTGKIECSVQLGTAGGVLPDLGIDEADMQDSMLIETRNFAPDHCAVFEGCVDGPGQRKLLRFNSTTPNYGPGDVFLGDPRSSNTFEYSSCHDHYHFKEYADYRLLDMAGNIVARGHKQAFCLVDLWQPPGLRGDPTPQFVHCGFQGISAGWADVYHRGLDCQWIDITGVPSGRYVLEVVINPAHVIPEHNYANNTARAEVVVP